MLPDLPELRRLLDHRERRRVQALAIQEAPLLAEVRSYHQSEGDRYSFQTRDEGRIRRQRFKRLKTKLTMDVKPSPEEQAAETGRKLGEAAKDIAKQQTQLMFETLSRSCDQAGTTFSAQGKPFHWSMFLDAIEKMWLDFDKDGNPIFPTIVMHPDSFKAIQPRLKEWEADPALRERQTRIIERKKEEWRARESDRKLAG